MLFSIPLNQALEFVQSLIPSSVEEELTKLHFTEVIHDCIGNETDDLIHYHLAMNAAWAGTSLARRKDVYPRTAGLMALNYIRDAGHLEIDIRDRLSELRLVVLACGEPDLITCSWWNANFYYFANLRILDTARACIAQYKRIHSHDLEEAKHMQACLAAFSGEGISEMTRLRSQAAYELTKLLDYNLRFITAPDFKPVPPPDWRDYKPRGQKWFDFVLERHMDALALALDVLDQSGDPRLALAVEALRECNEVLDKAALEDGEEYPGEPQDSVAEDRPPDRTR